MSTRRSGRAKAPVKYTSDSEGSDFGAKKRKAPASKKKGEQATPKKPAKRSADAEATTTTIPTPKRRKKDPEELAAELREKAAAQDSKAQKAQHKQAWETWQTQHDAKGKLLDAEPSRDDSITQTDSQKKYGLKPGELGSLVHFEKRHPTYHNKTVKLFREREVRELAWRKFGMLAGGTDDADVLKKGEEMWRAEFGDDVDDDANEKEKGKADKEKLNKQKWTEYISSHTLPSDKDDDERYLADEPDVGINQTDCKAKYHLTPAELGVLPFFQKKSGAYGGTVKLFTEREVEKLAWRKAAVMAGVDGDGQGVLEKGREIFEGKETEKE